MKSIKLMFLMILALASFTACDSGSEQISESNNENTIASKDELVWTELQDLEKREDVISTVVDYINGTECSTCKARCRTTANYGHGQYVVNCDDGTQYWVSNCGGEWHVMQAMETYYGNTSHTPIFYPCP